MDVLIRDKFLPLLEEKKILTKVQADKILKEAELRKQSILETVLKEKIVSEETLAQFIAEELGVSVVDPLTMTPAPEVLAMIDKAIAKKYHVVPLSFENNVLRIALANPLNIIVVDDLRALLGHSIQPCCAFPHKLEAAYQKWYEKTAQAAEQDDQTNIDDIIAEATDELEVVEHQNDVQLGNLVQAAEETPVIRLTNLILSEGIKRRASDIFIEPWEKHMSVRCRVDGLLEEMKAPPRSMASSIVSRLKVMSSLDIAERRMPQDGRFKIKYQDRYVDIRVSVLPSSFGEKVCMRILDKRAQSQQLDKLGFTEEEMNRIKAAADKPHGMLLVTGPTGSGKTTTLYSVLSYLDSPEKNITTVEDPVEYQMYGINQVQIRDHVGLTFPAALRSILRQDPDIIMVGEIRDITTMDISIKAALTGHLVLSTLHTNDACGSIVRITNMGIEPFLISSSVLMVSAQRLIRKVCMDCREPYEASDELLREIRHTDKKGITLYRSVGCEACRGSGYAGRTVITEVLPITAGIRELIMQAATGETIKMAARKEGMSTLRECGVRKVLAGESTLEEVYRVTAADAALE